MAESAPWDRICDRTVMSPVGALHLPGESFHTPVRLLSSPPKTPLSGTCHIHYTGLIRPPYIKKRNSYFQLNNSCVTSLPILTNYSWSQRLNDCHQENPLSDFSWILMYSQMEEILFGGQCKKSGMSIALTICTLYLSLVLFSKANSYMHGCFQNENQSGVWTI